jgi:hypothetical protein
MPNHCYKAWSTCDLGLYEILGRQGNWLETAKMFRASTDKIWPRVVLIIMYFNHLGLYIIGEGKVGTGNSPFSNFSGL